MATRLDDGRIVFAPVARDAPIAEPVLSLAVELQRALAPPQPRGRPQGSKNKEPPAKLFRPKWSAEVTTRVRALRALMAPYYVIEELTSVPVATVCDMCLRRQGRYVSEAPSDKDILDAASSLARWAIEQRGKPKRVLRKR